MPDTVGFVDRGTRALVILHERELLAFLDVWRVARARGIALPETADPAYASLDALLAHVLRAARGYLVWVCDTLGLSDPGIRPAPEPDAAAVEADAYVEHLVGHWRRPLAGIDGRTRDLTEAPCRWGPTYCVDAMLEHAVMHPLRHRFQLEEALAGAGEASGLPC